MLVSIIIPIYNKEDFIGKLLQTIITQTHTELEIILINDGSTDNSLRICQEFEKKDSRIKLYNQKNLGVSEARNKGIELANGKYIVFIDSDDYIAKNYIEELVTNIEEDTIVRCNYNKKKVKIYESEEYLEKIISGEVLGVCWGYLFEKDKLMNLKFDKNTAYMEDTIFMVEYIQKISRVKLINQKLYYHTKNDKSLTADAINIEKKINQYMYSLDKIKQIIIERQINIKNLEKGIQKRKIKIVEAEFAKIHDEKLLKEIMRNTYIQELLQIRHVDLKYKLFIKLLRNRNTKDLFRYIKFRAKIKKILKGCN